MLHSTRVFFQLRCGQWGEKTRGHGSCCGTRGRQRDARSACSLTPVLVRKHRSILFERRVHTYQSCRFTGSLSPPKDSVRVHVARDSELVWFLAALPRVAVFQASHHQPSYPHPQRHVAYLKMERLKEDELITTYRCLFFVPVYGSHFWLTRPSAGEKSYNCNSFP